MCVGLDPEVRTRRFCGFGIYSEVDCPGSCPPGTRPRTGASASLTVTEYLASGQAACEELPPVDGGATQMEAAAVVARYEQYGKVALPIRNEP